METQIAPSFMKSLKKLNMKNTWWYKTYEFIRFELPAFFRNFWRFRKFLWNYRWWDYRYLLESLTTPLDYMADRFETDGMEVDVSRMKKVAMMRRASELIKNVIEDNFIEKAEAELGELVSKEIRFEPAKDNPGYFSMIDDDTEEEKEHRRKVFERSREIEEEEWTELFKILRGQDWKEYQTVKNIAGVETDWEDWFDGSGMKSWWN